MSALIIALYVATTSAALIVLKLGSKDGSLAQIVDGRFVFNLTPLIFTGIVLYAASFLIYMYLVSKFDLGYIIPLTTALVYMLIFVASFLIFKEAFTFVKVGGIILIIFGLVLLNLKQ